MSRSREISRRTKIAITAGVALALFGTGIGVAAAGGESAAPTVDCPTVGDKLSGVPASAQAEVSRNLALLNTQIDEANRRLATSQGEGGPNFVQNAILGPLKDKRVATIDRIAISIGRQGTRPQGLESLATCTLAAGGGGGAAEDPEAPAGEPPAEEPPAEEPPAQEEPPAGEVGTITCPDVESELPAVPAGAQAEVDRNLALLETQIAEANARLVSTVGQGGPNFVQNAILGPLESKRVATINRIATAIGRIDARPVGLDALAPCTVS
ncbi:hypothetical protein RB614_02840 [Phytohabitans sp. ZYX-F-186]|uniref:Secreted protein n=1 Tax=Phytohabitans maris TaxID=3071409 RepID=A0ABU0Z8S1_9ACTN|nr:hypothetical protein [Phytohabitans sp. ZYX-F-186]MDQ7903450.1 hypothetical protein [Phytohabitans sp. ZYX-F-186]